MERLSHSRLLEVLSYDPKTGIFRWKARTSYRVAVGDVAGSRHGQSNYQRIMIDGVAYKSHRLAWFYVRGEWPNGLIDHVDGKPSNNEIANLREATPSQNRQNVHLPKSNNKVGKIGVTQRSKSRFESRISIDGVQKTIGSFKSADAAHAAYVERKRSVHEYCSL